eukprot:Polyplicarium_translucidae@DN3187_c0_g3_i1.p1
MLCVCCGCETKANEGNVERPEKAFSSSYALPPEFELPIGYTTYSYSHGIAAGVLTPRQLNMMKKIALPSLNLYPAPPGETNAHSLNQDQRRDALASLYRHFVLDIIRGLYLTQITAGREYATIHCQLADDFSSLILDQNDGRLIEFPLDSVRTVYVLVRTVERPALAVEPRTVSPPGRTTASDVPKRKAAQVPKLNFSTLKASAEYILVVEFSER